ncbi:monocarboxylate transporter 9-like [Argiope bruennichi]|uniref:monocarboxylate transporter 9-like n=1 Tax=Argiope bruennichi TaxID=94029 RepID=UPI002494817A|nr:monocarboxylate transporter 9-like [Argiope bruennichi]
MATLEEPDKGYAWVIAFAACIINMILSGMSRMIGILYVAIIDEYGVTRKEASVPFTVRNAIRYLSGPLVGVLGQRYGIRPITFLGGFIACLGSVLCCFAPTVAWISVFWGAIHGLGFSLGNTLFQVVVNQYFEKYRATASGIVLSGACVGSFGFPLMIECILDNYGLFGCFLILGGVFLNVMPPSLILKSPPWIEYPEAYARQRALLKGNEVDVPKDIKDAEAACKRRRRYSRSLSNCSIQEFDVLSIANGSQKRFYPDIRSLTLRKLKLDAVAEAKEKTNVVCTSYSSRNISFHNKRQTLPSITENLKNGTNGKSKSSVYHIYGNEHSEATEELPAANGEKTSSKKSEANESLWQIMKNIALLYKNPVYLLISMNVATYFWLFIPILTVVVDFSRDKGLALENEKFLIHAITLGDLVGRLCFGWVTDKNVLSFPVFMMLTFVFQGFFVALLPFAMSFVAYMIVLVLYGITAGIIFVYFPVLVYKYVDENNQAIGVGCVGLISGVVTFGIPPLIGYFRDRIGSYDGLFYIIGLLSIITGCLWLLEPVFLRKTKKEKEAANTEES